MIQRPSCGPLLGPSEMRFKRISLFLDRHGCVLLYMLHQLASNI
jgi:hypothetical protein